jgi:hypothetical protein
VVKLVDAEDSKSSGGNSMTVRFRPPAPIKRSVIQPVFFVLRRTGSNEEGMGEAPVSLTIVTITDVFQSKPPSLKEAKALQHTIKFRHARKNR